MAQQPRPGAISARRWTLVPHRAGAADALHEFEKSAGKHADQMFLQGQSQRMHQESKITFAPPKPILGISGRHNPGHILQRRMITARGSQPFGL